jgi:uncharacterized protein YeaO (DUF488 family)
MAVGEIVVARVGHAAAGTPDRVLVDRLWPRGVRRIDAPWDEWLKEVAPTTALRQWYGHDPVRYEAFRQRYREELAAGRDTPGMRHLVELARTRSVVLLTASADIDRSHVPILADFLAQQLRGPAPAS